MTITIHRLTSHAELRGCEDLQTAIWNMAERDIVPMHELVAVNMHGGFTLGAFDEDILVGFLYGYTAFLDNPTDPRIINDRRFYHASQMMGVLPTHQGQGIGQMLKQRQRVILIEQGFHLVTWTFDPLLSRNAYLNINKLGAIGRIYIRNLYDDLPGINSGMPTDRVNLEWWIQSQRVEGILSPTMDGRSETNQGDASIINPNAPDDNPPLPDADEFLVRIPRDIDAIKAADVDQARRWRVHIRAILESAFAAGYVITGVKVFDDHSAYVLTRIDESIIR